MKKTIIISIFFVLCCGCGEQSKIKIPNTLEIALDNNYSNYVINLNKAIKKDNEGTLNLLNTNNIHDAAGYDHGYILYQIMKIYGDKEYAMLLKKISSKNLFDVRQYFEVGLDSNDKEKNKMIKEYPNCSLILQIK